MSHFGTDGIRAKATAFTASYLERIALAALAVEKNAHVVIGRDTRESGLEIEEKLTKSLLDHGGRVTLCGIVPTPTLAYLTKKLDADFGIVISASHNPPEYNGIKFFSRSGEKIDDATEKEIERHIDEPLCATKMRLHEASYYYGDGEYVSYLINATEAKISGLRICLDCANGATASIAPKLFALLGAEVTAYNTETDGKRINDGCGATHTEFLKQKMDEGDFDIGFSYDGDGDRVMAYANGKLFDGDHLLYLHAKQMKKKNKLKKNVLVVTVMSNMGVQNACEKAGITFIRTQVGDKYVHREIVENGYCLGGEQSGHLIFFDYMQTGDGVLSSLLTAILCKETNFAAEDDIEEYPTCSDGYYCDKESVKRFYTDEVLQKYLNSLCFDGRIVVRPSGTEPKIRIMVEAREKSVAESYAKEIRAMLESRLG